MGKYTRTVYRQRLGKQLPAATNTQATIEMLLSYKNGNGVFCVVRAESVEFCTRVGEGRTWAREAVESPLLEAVAKERLVKAQQAGKGLVVSVVICKLWKWTVAL
jgi:hypothetical protein